MRLCGLGSPLVTHQCVTFVPCVNSPGLSAQWPVRCHPKSCWSLPTFLTAAQQVTLEVLCRSGTDRAPAVSKGMHSRSPIRRNKPPHPHQHLPWWSKPKNYFFGPSACFWVLVIYSLVQVCGTACGGSAFAIHTGRHGSVTFRRHYVLARLTVNVKQSINQST